MKQYAVSATMASSEVKHFKMDAENPQAVTKFIEGNTWIYDVINGRRTNIIRCSDIESLVIDE